MKLPILAAVSAGVLALGVGACGSDKLQNPKTISGKIGTQDFVANGNILGKVQCETGKFKLEGLEKTHLLKQFEGEWFTPLEFKERIQKDTAFKGELLSWQAETAIKTSCK